MVSRYWFWYMLMTFPIAAVFYSWYVCGWHLYNCTWYKCQASDIELNLLLLAIEKLLATKRLSCNSSKTSYMTVESRRSIIASKDMTLSIYGKTTEKKTTTKLLGVHTDESLSCDNQISHILRMACVCSIKLDLFQLTEEHWIYWSIVLPYFGYCNLVWGNFSLENRCRPTTEIPK